ncbi:MAG: hypothetical protein J1E02_02885, partial [Coprobacter sp.]|nr:hypothetical protein [Coprobacter sp.]
ARKYSLRYKAEAAPACRRAYMLTCFILFGHVTTCPYTGPTNRWYCFTGSVARTCHDMSLRVGKQKGPSCDRPCALQVGLEPTTL